MARTIVISQGMPCLFSLPICASGQWTDTLIPSMQPAHHSGQLCQVCKPHASMTNSSLYISSDASPSDELCRPEPAQCRQGTAETSTPIQDLQQCSCHLGSTICSEGMGHPPTKMRPSLACLQAHRDLVHSAPCSLTLLPMDVPPHNWQYTRAPPSHHKQECQRHA